MAAVAVDRHQLDGVDPEIDERIELVDGGGEGAGARSPRSVEAPDVQLVDDGRIARGRREGLRLPHVRPRIDDHGLVAVDHASARIDTRDLAAVLRGDDIVIALSSVRSVDARREHAGAGLEHERAPRVSGASQLAGHRDRLRVRCPYAKLDAAFVRRRADQLSARRRGDGRRRRRSRSWHRGAGRPGPIRCGGVLRLRRRRRTASDEHDERDKRDKRERGLA